jgi:hypothetical protein
MRRFHSLMIILALVVLILTACAKSSNPGTVVEDYLKAKVSAKADKMVSLSCSAWEAQAQQESAAFESVSAELKDLSCKKSGEEGEYTLVTCEGKLVIQYRGETPREQNLNGTTYRTVKQDGEWKMCGTQE